MGDKSQAAKNDSKKVQISSILPLTIFLIGQCEPRSRCNCPNLMQNLLNKGETFVDGTTRKSHERHYEETYADRNYSEISRKRL